MTGFNRLLIVLFALAWCAALGVIAWLVWDQTRFIEYNEGGVEFMFNVTFNRTEQVLASFILAVLALPALTLLMLETKRSRPRRVDTVATAEDDRIGRLQSQVESLERRLAHDGATEPARVVEEPATIERREPVAREARSRRWRMPSMGRR
jgi:hypothetical protein